MVNADEDRFVAFLSMRLLALKMLVVIVDEFRLQSLFSVICSDAT